MEGLAVIGFVFGMVGVVALVCLEKLTETLKQKGNSRRGLQGGIRHPTNLLNLKITKSRTFPLSLTCAMFA